MQVPSHSIQADNSGTYVLDPSPGVNPATHMQQIHCVSMQRLFVNFAGFDTPAFASEHVLECPDCIDALFRDHSL